MGQEESVRKADPFEGPPSPDCYESGLAPVTLGTSSPSFEVAPYPKTSLPTKGRVRIREGRGGEGKRSISFLYFSQEHLCRDVKEVGLLASSSTP